MAKSFDINGSGEPIPEGSGFDAPNGLGSGEAPVGDAYGSTTLGDGPSDPRGGDFVFDAERHIGRHKLNADGSYRRKRQRRGSGGQRATSNRPKADIQASIDGLSKTLMVMHIGLAEMTKTPELVLQEAESDALASSVANVLGEFDITPDPKVQAIVGLLMTAGMIYGPRMYNIKERIKNSEKPSASIHSIRPVDNNSQVMDTPVQ